MCIRCNSKQEVFNVYERGALCGKCTTEWKKLYFSQTESVRLDSEKIWGKNGLWEQFMKGGKEVVIFT